MEPSFEQIGRIEAISRLFEGTGFSPFQEPILEKCPKGSSIVSASHLLLEGTDFNLEYFPLKHLGYKSVIAVVGELYAALAEPLTLSLSIGVSSKLDFGQIAELWNGVVAAAKEHGLKQLSLDLLPSLNGLAISLSATAFQKEKLQNLHPKSESKDLICISGSLGSAFFGQQVLLKKREDLETYKMMVADYLKPELSPRILSNLEDAGICPSEGLFVNRGLSDAILRLVRKTGLGAKVYADKIPFEGNSFALGKDLNIDPISAAMNGGEDFRLLYVIKLSDYQKFRTDFQVFDIIGHLALSEVGAVLLTPDGLEHPIKAQGWVETGE